MLRRMIVGALGAVEKAARTAREWLEPTVVMKGGDFDRPLDDLGQAIEDVERRAQPPEAPSREAARKIAR